MVMPYMARPGYLKVFLGYASGVGKSFRMLDEARRRRERGQDVVVAGVQPSNPPEVEDLLRKLEVVPLDLDALIERRPTVCFIDGLAYGNPPGAKNPTRWRDVEDLLAAGIKVIGSVNIQYIEELRDRVEPITGKRVSETVPLSFIQRADEIELVDAPPDGAGDVRQSYSRLRELALVLTADVVDRQLIDYLADQGIQGGLGAHERILVCLTPRANIGRMMESARLVADRFHADLIAAYVRQDGLSAADRAAVEEKLAAARAAGASVEILEDSGDPVETILDFARSRGVTQLFIGHSRRAGLATRLWGNPVDRLIRDSRGMDVRIFPQ